MNSVFQLFQLQEIDSAIDRAQKRISEIQNLISRNETVSAAQTQAEIQEKQFVKQKNEFDTLNDEVQSKKIKKSQSESSLYSGTISNPKELQDLQKEITFLNSTISSLEDQLLQKLIQLEMVENNLSEAKTELRKVISEFETNKAILTGEMNQLETQVKSYQKQREPILGQITPSNSEIYQSIRKTKNGIAVAKLDEDSCSACGTSLTASQRQQSRSPGSLFFCPGCGRIIYGS